MGNSIGGRKKVRVMKITGETLKIKTPVRAWDIIKDHPGHVLLESEAVKRFGVRAKPMEPQQDLESKKIYFLVQLPKFPEERVPRRTRSIGGGAALSAKERLDCMLLYRRSVSDLSITRPVTGLVTRGPESSSGPLRVKMRLPRDQMAKLVNESRDKAEVADKIIDLFMENKHGEEEEEEDDEEDQWQPGLGTIVESFRSREVFLK